MSASPPAPANPLRDQLNGLLFVGLLASAVVQVASMPSIRSLGLSPLVVGIVGVITLDAVFAVCANALDF